MNSSSPTVRVVEITVGAGTGFNHPYEQYSNFKPSVAIKAVIDLPCSESVFEDALKQLQKSAHEQVLAEKSRILADLKRERDIEYAERVIENLQSGIDGDEKRIPDIETQLRKDREALASIAPDVNDASKQLERSNLECRITNNEERLACHPANRAKAKEKIAAYRLYVAALRRGESAKLPSLDGECPF